MRRHGRGPGRTARPQAPCGLPGPGISTAETFTEDLLCACVCLWRSAWGGLGELPGGHQSPQLDPEHTACSKRGACTPASGGSQRGLELEHVQSMMKMQLPSTVKKTKSCFNSGALFRAYGVSLWGCSCQNGEVWVLTQSWWNTRRAFGTGLTWGSCDKSKQNRAGKVQRKWEEARAALLLEWGQAHPKTTGTSGGPWLGAEGSACIKAGRTAVCPDRARNITMTGLDAENNDQRTACGVS